jgi:hypothetical protein
MYNPKQLKYVGDKDFENYMYNNHFYSQVNTALAPPVYDVTPVTVYDQKVARRNIMESFLWNPVQTLRGYNVTNRNRGVYNQQYGGGYSNNRSNFTSHLEAPNKPAASTKQCCDLLNGLSSEYPAEFPCAGSPPADWATSRAGKKIDFDMKNRIINSIKNIDVYYSYVDKIKNVEGLLANSNNSPSAELTLGINLSTYKSIKKKLENEFLDVLGFIPSTDERNNCTFDTNTFSYTNMINREPSEEDSLMTRIGLPKMTGGINVVNVLPKVSDNASTQRIFNVVVIILFIATILAFIIIVIINRKRIGRSLNIFGGWLQGTP